MLRSLSFTFLLLLAAAALHADTFIPPDPAPGMFDDSIKPHNYLSLEPPDPLSLFPPLPQTPPPGTGSPGNGFGAPQPDLFSDFSIQLAEVPEPATWILLLAGAGALGALRLRSR